MKKKAKFVVLGSTSFSGSWVTEHLLSNGHEVLGIGRQTNLHSCFLPYLWREPIHKKFEFLSANINTDIDIISNSVKKFKPEYIINFIAQGMVAESWKTPNDWFKTNVLSQVGLLEILKELPNLTKYIHFTTPEVYGSTPGWIKETNVFFPSTPYATSRAAFDMHLMTYFKSKNFPVIFTRASNVFGPGQPIYRIVPRAVWSAITGKKFFLDGGGTSERNFIDIRDVARAIELIAEYGQPGKTYHISGTDSFSIYDLVSLIAKKFMLNINDLCDVGPERLGKDDNYLLDSSFLRSSLSWKEDFTIEQSIEGVKSWIEDNYSSLRELPIDYVHRP